MGVKGLWKLLLPIGRRISLEALRGQILAIDASIWLTQFVKAMRDSQTGQATAAAHLIGFFRRLCRLLFYNIRPVLVFDGRAPEIKRRELIRRRQQRNEFGGEQEQIQRLARKLVHETLLKQQTSLLRGGAVNEKEEVPVKEEEEEKSGAFVRGFHPEGVANGALPPRGGVSQNSPSQPEGDVIDRSTSEPWDETKREMVPTDNDWDIPLAVAAMEEAKELDALDAANEDHNDDDDDVLEYEDFIPPSDAARTKKKNIAPWMRGMKTSRAVASVAQIALLPAAERKDAIETVQRQRRLQSRKEFLPAAHDPRQFSNVQLSNFLKSCQLNKDIVSMAKQVVQQQSAAEGGALMEADRTTRIELIRENETEKKETRPSFLVNASSYTLNSAVSRYSDASRSEEDDNEDDDEKEEVENSCDDDSSNNSENYLPWDPVSRDGDDDAAVQKALWNDAQEATPKKRRRIVIDVDEEEDDDVSIQKSQSKGSDDNTEVLQKEEVPHVVAVSSIPRGGEEDDAVDWEEGDETRLVDDEKPVVKETCVVDTNDDDDNVDWEDGDDARNESTITSSPLNESLPGRDDSDIKLKSSPVSTDGFSGDFISSPSKESSAVLDLDKPRVFSKGNSDALIQAQATASQLTNWAGRAFRRAIAEAHGEHAIKSALQVPSDPENPKDVDDDDSCVAIPISDHAVSKSHDMKGLDSDPFVNESAENLREEFKPSRNVTHTNSSAANVTTITYDAAFLERSDAEWTAERNRRERDMETISDEMLLEVKQLLQLFGIPFLEAPAEAEAQCVALESLGLVDGIVTEDSDVFVFGGKTVYKNIFEEQKYAEVYNSSDAEREMKLGHNSMVALAMLLGGDYTEGVKGVGIVNAMEILDAFDVSQGVRDGLKSFRTWLDGFNPPEVHTEDDGKDSPQLTQKGKESAFHLKHMSARTRWIVPQNFPAENVIKAYMDPVVDKSTERFSWGGTSISLVAL